MVCYHLTRKTSCLEYSKRSCLKGNQNPISRQMEMCKSQRIRSGFKRFYTKDLVGLVALNPTNNLSVEESGISLDDLNSEPSPPATSPDPET